MRQRGSEFFAPIELTEEHKKIVADSFIPDAYMQNSERATTNKSRKNKKVGKKKGKKKR